MKLKNLAIGAVAALGITAMPVQASAQIDNNMIQQIAIMLLADKLGIDSGGILGALGGSGGSIFDMAPAFALQQYAPQSSAQQIFQLRQGGLPWDQVATRVGVPQERYVQLRNSGHIDNNQLWRSTYQSKFGLSTNQINTLRGMGLNWQEIGKAAVIAREAGVGVDKVGDRYRRTRNWTTVATYYRVNRDSVSKRISSWRTSKSLPSNWRTERINPTWRNDGVHPSSNGKKLGHLKNKAKNKAKKKSKGKSKGKGKN